MTKNWNVRLTSCLAFFSLFLLVSCSSSMDDMQAQYGQLTVSLAQPDVQVVTKAAEVLPSTDPSASDYTVRLYKGDGTIQHQAKHNEFGTQQVPLGVYYVTVESCSEAEAEQGNGRMRLFGRSADVEVSMENLVHSVSVECTVQNAKFTVAFGEVAVNKIENLKVVLTRDTRNVTVSKEDGATECWFNPGTVSYTISGSYNGNPLEKSGSVVLEAKSNVRLQVKVNLDKGELLSPEVNFQNVVDTEDNVSEGFNPYE